MASGIATVKEVISGDTLVLVGAPKDGPPPEKRVSLSSVTAPRVALKTLTHESPDEPYGWPAREFMRTRLIGQQVQFKVEYQFNGREYACVMFKGENVACELLRKGLAKLRDNKNPPNAHDLEELERCEAEAKSKQLGLFSADPGNTTVRNMTWAVADADYVSSFASKYMGKQLPAVVEYVRDGGSMRLAIQIPNNDKDATQSFAYCAVSLSGLQCPIIRRDAEGNNAPEPYYAEARFFVEIRLLNRDVHVRIEGSDDFGNLLGTIIHPNGEIGLLLLSNGFAKVNNATAQLTEAPAKLRAAMKDAQANRLRRWKDMAAPTQSDGLEKVYFATVEEVISGDSLILQLANGESRRVYLASIRCMRPGGPNKAQPREEEAIALEAKELVRKKAIGKQVKVFLEYIKAPFTSATGGPSPPPSDSKGNMHFVSIYVGSPKVLGVPQEGESQKVTEERRGQNVTELLLQAGLAKTIPHRAEDDQAEKYDVYQTLEKEAQTAKRGCFAPPQDVKIIRMVDLMGPANTQRAIAHLQQLQRHALLDAVVENVFNAGRYRLRIPSQSLSLSFVLSGIRCPQTARAALPGGPKERQAEPFGAEALQYTRTRILQRDVQIHVEQCDRGGNFIGSLFYGPKKSNLAAELLEVGFAQTVPFSLQRATHKDILVAAEQKAKDARRNLWGLPGALDDEVEEEVNTEKIMPAVVVSHVEKFDLFYIQDEKSPELDKITAEIEELVRDPPTVDVTFTPGGLPRKGEIILGQHAADHLWYRARVEGRDGNKVSVLYIDYGTKETLPLERMRRCPAVLGAAAIPPQAIPCVLSGLLPPPDMDYEAADTLANITLDVTLHCLIEGLDSEKRRRCVLTPVEAHAEKRPSINEQMLAMGLALFDRKTNCKFATRFAAEEQVARKQHLNVWRYGDIGEDDEDDDYPSLGNHKRTPPRR